MIKDNGMNKIYQHLKKCNNYFVVLTLCIIFVYINFIVLSENTLMHNHWKYVNMAVGILIFINYCIYRHFNNKQQDNVKDNKDYEKNIL